MHIPAGKDRRHPMAVEVVAEQSIQSVDDALVGLRGDGLTSSSPWTTSYLLPSSGMASRSAAVK